MESVGIPLQKAKITVERFATFIRPYCDRLEVGGSIRRGKATVKDAELIAISNGTALLDHLDKLVADGLIRKALYGETKTTRWGEAYRGLDYDGLRIEVFITNPESWGYQYWLRTGPGDANQYLMTWLSWKHALIRFQDGAAYYAPKGWRKDKTRWTADERIKLALLEEASLFRLLGIPFVEPAERSETLYKTLLNAPTRVWPAFEDFYAAPVSEKRLFEDDTPVVPAAAEEPFERKVWWEQSRETAFIAYRCFTAKLTTFGGEMASGQISGIERNPYTAIMLQRRLERGADVPDWWTPTADKMIAVDTDIVAQAEAVLREQPVNKMPDRQVVSFRDVKQHWDAETQTWDDDRLVYIGRVNPHYHLPASPWQNPYRVTKDMPAGSSLKAYRHWITVERVGMDFERLRGKILVCWCRDEQHPDRPCHGDVLLEILQERERV